MKTLFWIGNSKGGVGKSMVAMALLDVLERRSEEVLLVECDTSNPDVWKAYEDRVPSELVNLDEADGWIHLVNLCEAHKEPTIVVNTPARTNEAIRLYGPTLRSALEELERQLVVLWVINRQRDSVELLRDVLEVFPSAALHVLRNAYFGEEKKFELYNASKTREAVEKRGGKSVTFPDLADRVADDVYSKRLALSRAIVELPLGNRAELARWRSLVDRTLAEVMP